jgi:osmotically-inducible protein OsmY
MPTVKMPEPEIGSGGSDFSLFTQIRSIILADQSMGDGVIIEVKEGTVTLSGTVSNEANRAKAAKIAQSLKGVKAVKNNLRIGN